ncbi:MAG: cobalt transporter [Thermosynechococcaceae cyanobacterium MS004]|nr:cobalt transporter [Thermosynechococcaceae cyanobacterium MS004]
MKPFPLISSILAVGLAISTPTAVFAHVGHGDEFQAQGGIERVKVNSETDQMLGIIVTPITATTDGGAAVMVPVTSLVDADGKQLVFVQYENFYEPVPVTTGATKGELIEVTQGLSVGEKLVTQGSLSLYAESRKTQTADTAASPQATSLPPNTTHAQADAQGIPHSHNSSDSMAQLPADATKQASGFPIGTLVAVGGGAVLLLGGAFAVMGGRKKKGGV